MQYTVLFVVMAFTHILSLGALLLVFLRTEKFMTKAMVYMKSNTIHEVMTASALLRGDAPEKAEDGEVVDTDDEKLEKQLFDAQTKHRQRHLKALGEDEVVG